MSAATGALALLGLGASAYGLGSTEIGDLQAAQQSYLGGKDGLQSMKAGRAHLTIGGHEIPLGGSEAADG